MPSIRLKPLSQQTIVITGASSGIGLATARMAAQAGARVMLIARNEEALKTIVEELRGRGAAADYAVADVGKLPDWKRRRRRRSRCSAASTPG